MPTENELLAELAAIAPLPYDPSLDVTAEDAARVMGISINATYAKLRAMEAAGILESRFAHRGDGYRVMVWRKVTSE